MLRVGVLICLNLESQSRVSISTLSKSKSRWLRYLHRDWDFSVLSWQQYTSQYFWIAIIIYQDLLRLIKTFWIFVDFSIIYQSRLRHNGFLPVFQKSSQHFFVNILCIKIGFKKGKKCWKFKFLFKKIQKVSTKVEKSQKILIVSKSLQKSW